MSRERRAGFFIGAVAPFSNDSTSRNPFLLLFGMAGAFGGEFGTMTRNAIVLIHP